MPRLCISAFILFLNGSFLCFIFQARRHNFIQASISFISTTIVNIKYPLCLNSKNRISVLLEMLSQYLARIIIRGVFRTQSNNYDGAFCKNMQWRLAIDYFYRRASSLIIDRVITTLLRVYFHSLYILGIILNLKIHSRTFQITCTCSK